MSAVYDSRLFWVRRTVRMHAHAGPATTHQAEVMAMRELQSGHSVAKALSTATKFLRNVRTVSPKDAA